MTKVRDRDGRMAVAVLLLTLVGCSAQADVKDATSTATATSTAPAKAEVRIELIPSSTDGSSVFVVPGLSAEELAQIAQLESANLGNILQVYAASDLAEPPAILGSTKVVGDSLQFTPRFELQPGLRYRAIFDQAAIGGARSEGGTVAAPGRSTAEFEIPKNVVETPTSVAQIYPSSNQLPENQLKFYIHFSAPMNRGEAYEHIHLLDSNGRVVEAPFLELTEELWDRELQRFTLLCDPGRVKQELKPREELGPVLERGKSYRLVIDRDWRDAHGNPLAAGAEKAFEVLAPDATPIDTNSWTIEAPDAGTKKPLVVRFPEPLDHALLERVVGIADANGNQVPGAIAIADQETRWEFTPEAPWTSGDYQLVAATTLEDLAGNSIGRAFEVDVTRAAQEPRNSDTVSMNTVSVPFQVAPAGDQLKD